MRSREGVVPALLAHRSTRIAEDTIDDVESGPQIWVLVIFGSHGQVSPQNGVERRCVGSIANALALDDKVEEGLGTGVSHVPEPRDDHRMS